MFCYEKPSRGAFLVLEGIKEKEMKKTYAKIIFVIKFSEDKKKILLGRSNDWDVKLLDNKISRFHAYFHSITKPGRETEIWIEDLSSKFGTLVGIDQGFALSPPNDTVTIQFNQIVVQLNYKVLKKSWFWKEKKPKDMMEGMQYSKISKYFSEDTNLAILNQAGRKTSKMMTTSNIMSADKNWTKQRVDLSSWDQNQK